jgi:hypothetical protein
LNDGGEVNVGFFIDFRQLLWVRIDNIKRYSSFLRRFFSMKYLKMFIFCSIALLGVGCLSDQPRDMTTNPPQGSESPPPPASEAECTEASANYRVTFIATWSAQTHPTDFPANPHFSGLVGGTHNAQAFFWREGMLASQGIENMAELGAQNSLSGEVNQAMMAGNADQVLLGGGISPSPGTVSLEFAISNQFPLITLVSMIAPSPDWFVGVDSLSLCENNEWVDQKMVRLEPYDAGTDAGATFDSADSDVEPQIPIVEITGAPFEVNGSVPSLGMFVFEKI